MKANGSFTDQGFLQSQYYAAYAQYFVKTIQAYQAQGVHVDYVSAQNEPGCCSGANYPTMAWTGSGLDYFTANDLLPAVHDGDSQSGQVTYTIEYYDMGQLTKFVQPGAYRIASTANPAVPNVAWVNPDGSKALIAYNETGGSQPITVNWGGESFTYTLPAQTSATFTWNGTQSGTSLSSTGQLGGYDSKCLDDTGQSATPGTKLQIWSCTGAANQQWSLPTG
jgi:O-glycosyl hydrolase